MSLLEKNLELPYYNWIVPSVDETFCQSLTHELNLSPLTSRMLCHRGIKSLEEADRFMRSSLGDIRSPFLLHDIDKAVDRILKAILEKEKILIYGDYDVDGLTSIAVLMHFLRYVGQDPIYHVPDRLQEGYGFHADCIDSFSQMGVQLIITVDCGITAFDAVDLANQCGIDVVVTDHHECADKLPAALAVLNPKIPGTGFPFRELAGVGVAFYLVMALRKYMREKGLWRRLAEPNLRDYLDLVALGTLADMVPLQQENRIFVKHGLVEISTAKRPGLFILKEHVGIEGAISHVRPILFSIIPRINAPGRLGCAAEALEILLCDDSVGAREIAKVLEGRNVQRRAIEDEVYREAQSLARQQFSQGDRCALILSSEGWHKGILGIVASRLAREFLRPVVLLSFDGKKGKGSVRSIDSLEVLDAVRSCREHLEQFGGHQMAAGLSLKLENLEGFKNAFEQAIKNKRDQYDRSKHQLLLDLWLQDPKELTAEMLLELEHMGPFGQGNAEPVIGIRNMKILDKRIVGEDHLKLTLGQGDSSFDAIGFQMGRKGIMESRCASWDIAFSPRREVWRGRSRIRFHLLDMQPSSSS